jgi:catalase
MTSTRDETTTLAEELVEAVATVLGSHPGHRVTHTKGIVLTGTFTATPRARELTRAAHLQGRPTRVTVRFSNGDPNPLCPDAAQNDPRGMAVKFYLPDGSTTDLVCQSWPVFPTGTPEGFLALIRAQGEGAERLDEFLAADPKVAAASAAIAAAGDPPQSWATMAFNSLVAYRLVNDAGEGRFARWRLAPEAGEQSLPEDQRATADRDYLMDGILDLLPVRYRLLAQLAADTDQTVDSSAAWPADREWVDMGVVEITGPDTERERDGDILVNDPMRVTDGIEPSDDPILHIRTYLYGESVRRRSGVERPATLH